MEQDSEEKLRQKLEALKRDLARKKSKIKHIERSRSAKDHVKTKIEEHKSRSTWEEDDFTQKSSKRCPAEVPSKEVSGSTLKAKTSHVSFCLPKTKSEDAHKASAENASDLPIADKSNIVNRVNQKKPFEVPCSQDEFKDLSHKTVGKSRIQIQRKKPTSVIIKPGQRHEITMGKKLFAAPVMTKSQDDQTASTNAPTNDSPRLPNTYPQRALKNRAEKTFGNSKSVLATDDNDLSNTAALSNEQSVKKMMDNKEIEVSCDIMTMKGSGVTTVPMNKESNGERVSMSSGHVRMNKIFTLNEISEPKLGGISAQDSSKRVTEEETGSPKRVTKEKDPKCVTKEKDSPKRLTKDLKEEITAPQTIDIALTSEKPIARDLTSPGSTLDNTSSGVKGGRGKRRTRCSTAMLDFSFLDEEDSGDMYSQIKTRRRRRGRHSLPADIRDPGGALLGLSQSQGGSQTPEGSPRLGWMPKLSHGLSQAVIPSQDSSKSLNRDGSEAPSVTSKESPCENSEVKSTLAVNTERLLQPLDSEIPSQFEFQKTKCSKRGRRTNTYLDKIRNQKFSPQTHSCPLLGDGGSVGSESPIHSTFPKPKYTRKSGKSSSKLMVLPHADVLREVTNFDLPEQDYGKLKESKVESQESKVESHESEALRESKMKSQEREGCGIKKENDIHKVDEKENIGGDTKVPGLKPQKLMKLPPKDFFNQVSHFVLPDSEYGLLKLSKIETMSRDLDGNAYFASGGVNTPNFSQRDSHRYQNTGSSIESVHTPGTANTPASSNSSKAKRRRSRKLSPIQKLTEEDPIIASSELEDSTLMDSEIIANSQLSVQDLDVGSELQRKVGRSGRNSQTRKNKKRKFQKPCAHNSAKPTFKEYKQEEVCETRGNSQTPSLDQTILNESTFCGLEKGSQNVNLDAEDPLNTGLLDDSVVADESRCDVKHVKTSSDTSGLRQVATVQLPREHGPVLCVDAVCGYIRNERGVVAALATSHQLQVWCRRGKMAWSSIQSWNIENKMVNRLDIMATGDVITVVAVTRATVEVYGHVMLGPAWSWTLHENTSPHAVDVLCCAVGDSLCVVDVSECGSQVVRYKLSGDWRSCQQTTGVGETQDQLVSLTSVRGQQGALLGTSRHHVYIWNTKDLILLVKMSLPVRIGRCFSAVAEHGLVFMWVSPADGQPPCLVVTNPNTAKSVVATSVDPPPGQALDRLLCISVDSASVIGVTDNTCLMRWEAASGRLCGFGLTLEEQATCLGPVRGSETGELLVTMGRDLRQYQAVL